MTFWQYCDAVAKLVVSEKDVAHEMIFQELMTFVWNDYHNKERPSVTAEKIQHWIHPDYIEQ